MPQVRLPPGASPGAAVAFPMPSGVTIQIVVPQGCGPGSVLEVADPGAAAPPVAAVVGAPPAYGAAAPPAYAAPPAAYAAPPPPAGSVVGIQANGARSDISGVTVVSDQTAPFGYDVLGDTYGIVAKTLHPGETFHSEPGAMVFMSNDVRMSAKFGRGFRGAVSQAVSGEALAKVEYTNAGAGPGYVGMTANQPFSTVIPVQLAALPGGSINVKRGAYMAGTPDVTASMKFLPARDLAACCCGGLPPVIQSVSGAPHGTAFLSAAGTIVAKNLQPGEAVVVDSTSIVGFENDVQFDVKRVGDCSTCCLGGEGCYNTVLTGPGNVYLQSISIDKLMAQLVTVQSSDDGGGGGDGAPATTEVMVR